MVHDLCAEHADAVTAPLGWQIRDLRDPSAREFDTDPEPSTLGARFDLIGA